MEDTHILTLLQQRAEQAISALAEAFGPRLRATALHILGNPLDAEEAVNDTYLAVWNAIPPEEPNPLCAYVYRIGRNTALNRLRRERAHVRNSQYDLSLDELSACIPGPSEDALLDARALGQAINAFLACQSRENRILFLRRYWFGDSVREIAQQWPLSENAISVRLHRLRNALRTYLLQEGYLDET